MKAVVYTKYGGPEVLQLTDVERPHPKENEVLIRVCSVSINDWDWGLLQGPFITRLNAPFEPKNKILCSDVAGRVEAVGRNVTSFKPGDEVFGDLSGRWGGLAEYVCAPENSLALKSPRMTFDDAAAIPQAGMLAVQGLIDRGEIKKGQRVLINGAGGGVGTLGVQIAKQYGASVTGVDSPMKLDMMRALGFDEVIDYTKEDFTRNGKQYDLILDAKTNRPIFHYARALRPHGIYATVGGSLSRLLQAVILGPWISMVTRKQIRIVVLKPNKDLEYMKDLFETGKLKPVIDGPYPLEDAAKAFGLFGRGEHKGKVVIRISK